MTFQANVSGGQRVGKAAPAKIRTESPLSGLAKGIASIAGVMQDAKEHEQEQFEAYRNEDIARQVLKMQTVRQDLQKEGLSSSEITNQINQQTTNAGFSAVETLEVRRILAEDWTGKNINDMVSEEQKVADEKRAQIKAQTDANNEVAQYFGLPNANGIDQNIVDAMAGDMYTEMRELKMLEKQQKELTLKAGTFEYKDKLATQKAETWNSILRNRVQVNIYSALQQADQEIQMGRAEGKTFTEDQVAEIRWNKITATRQMYDQQVASTVAQLRQEDPVAANKLEALHAGRIEAFNSTTTPIKDWISNEFGKTQATERALMMQKNAEIAWRSDPVTAVIQTAIDMRWADPSTIQQSMTGQLSNLLSDASSLDLANFKIPSSPNVSPLSVFLDNAPVDPNTGVQNIDTETMDKAGTLTADAQEAVVKEDLPTTEVQKTHTLSQTRAHWDSLAGNPQAAMFGTGSIDLATRLVLGDAWDSLPADMKEQAADLMPEIATNFFGGSKTGAYAPALAKELNDLVSGYGFSADESAKVYQLSVDPKTSLIRFDMADDETLKRMLLAQKQRVTARGTQIEVTDQELSRLKTSLREFGRRVNYNVSSARMLQATAKATDQPLALISGLMLDKIASSSKLNVDPKSRITKDSGDATGSATVEREAEDNRLANMSFLDFSDWRQKQILAGKKKEELPELMQNPNDPREIHVVYPDGRRVKWQALGK